MGFFSISSGVNLGYGLGLIIGLGGGWLNLDGLIIGLGLVFITYGIFGKRNASQKVKK